MANRRGKVEAMTDFVFLGFKNHGNSDYSHEIKRCLLFGGKAMTNLDSVLKIRDITLLTKVHIIKTIFIPVVMHGSEKWSIKKVEHWRIDAFEFWCWGRLLGMPWTARKSNRSFLKEINPKYSLQGLLLKLKLQYFGHLMWSSDSLEKTLMLGKIEGKRRRGWKTKLARESVKRSSSVLKIMRPFLHNHKLKPSWSQRATFKTEPHNLKRPFI